MRKKAASTSLLSTGVDPPRLRQRLLLNPTGTPPRSPERFIEWVQAHQKPVHGFAVAAVTLFAPLAFCALVPVYWTSTAVADATTISNTFTTLAEISAGIAGVLLAVVVFSVQLHAQRDDEGAFMTSYLVKKQYIPCVVGYAIGFAGFCSAILCLDVLGVPLWLHGVVFVSGTGLLLLLIATFWFVVESIRDASKPTFDLGFRLFRRDLAGVIAFDSYTSELNSRFAKELDSTIIGQNRQLMRDALRRSGTINLTTIEVCVNGMSGEVVDIDLAAASRSRCNTARACQVYERFQSGSHILAWHDA